MDDAEGPPRGPSESERPPETLFVGTFLHSIHRAYADRIGADYFYLFGPDHEEWGDVAGGTVSRVAHYRRKAFEIPKGYDYYLLEGGTALLPGAMFKLRHPGATLILLNADETYINVVEGLEHYGSLDRTVHRVCTRALSGVVNVGGFADEYFRRAGFDHPGVVVYPGIDDDLYDALGELDPSAGSKNVVVVGYGRHHPRRTGGSSTGFDLLVEAMDDVRSVHPEAELHVAGEGHPPEWDDRDGVTLHGWVDDLPSFFELGEVSAHPGRSESFSVAALEPMRAARPCLVSDMVGAKEVVSEVSPSLVCRPTAGSVADALVEYFDRPASERIELGRRSRAAVEPFRSDRVVEEFAGRYQSLLERL